MHLRCTHCSSGLKSHLLIVTLCLQVGEDSLSAGMLQRLHAALEATHTFPDSSEVIGARVPILTGRLLTGMPADISFQQGGEPGFGDAGMELMARCDPC